MRGPGATWTICKTYESLARLPRGSGSRSSPNHAIQSVLVVARDRRHRHWNPGSRRPTSRGSNHRCRKGFRGCRGKSSSTSPAGDAGRCAPKMRAFLRQLAYLAVYGTLGIVLTLAVGAGIHVAHGPALMPWHTATLDAEFRAADAPKFQSLADYRALEARLRRKWMPRFMHGCPPNGAAPSTAIPPAVSPTRAARPRIGT